MKAVLISIQPKWVEKIASGKKTIEVRKTRPKNETPFKCYIYCTKEKTRLEHTCIPTTYENLILNKNIDFGCQVHFYNGIPKNELCTMLNGKVIGEFVCDRIYEWKYRQLQGLNGTINTYFPIFVEDLLKTCLTHKDLENYGKGKPLYGWHISNLKIYDKPKELSEFYNLKGETIKRAYQSWGYINV